MKLIKWLRNRVNILKLASISIAFLLIYRLFYLQIIQGDSYYKASQDTVYKKLVTPAPRGEITDCNGAVLVKSKPGYELRFTIKSKSDIHSKKINKELLHMYNIFTYTHENLDYIMNKFPIDTSSPMKFKSLYKFLPEDFYKLNPGTKLSSPSISFNKSHNIIYFKLKKTGSKKGKTKEITYKYTPKKILELLRKRYNISSDVTGEPLMFLVSLKYKFDTQLQNFKSYEPVTLLPDVSLNTLGRIKEAYNSFKNITDSASPVREYNEKALYNSPITGYTGKISGEEYGKVDKKVYRMDDLIGKTGIEKYAEKYLKGKDGTEYVKADFMGKSKHEEYSILPKKGNKVVLTIDNNLQRTAEKSFRYNLYEIQHGLDGRIQSDATSGAVVAIDVHTGEVLCLISYPYFNSNDFTNGISQDKWNQIVNNKDHPMFNKAISDAYPPGSTFKILTSIAALQENKITPTEQILDLGEYKNTHLTCLEYRKYHYTHGYENVEKAIAVSCNYFFYELGHRLGIDTIDKYAAMFGLGQKTGIELDSEISGQVASPALRKDIYKGVDKVWVPGFTYQTAIGQCDTAVTPIQLASYLSTVVNGGTRYKVHLIKEVRDSKTNKIVVSNSPKVLGKINMRADTYNAVMEGMSKVTKSDPNAEGTASGAFWNFPVPVGGKTGSATIGNQNKSDAWFMAFAPYNNPQVAVVAFVKNGGAGSSAAFIVRDVLQEYFRKHAH